MQAQPHQPRTRHLMTNDERQRIRQKHRQNSGWTQARLAEWASKEFGRPIRQSVVSDSLKPRYGYGEVVQYEASATPKVRSWVTQTSLEQSSAQISSCTESSPWDQLPHKDDLRNPHTIPNKSADLMSLIHVAQYPIENVRALHAPPGSWVSDSTETEEDEEDIQKPSKTRGKIYGNRTRAVRINGTHSMNRDHHDPDLPQSATASHMYLAQFFSRIVNNALNHSNKTSTVDVYTTWFMSVYNRASTSHSSPVDEALRCVLTRHAAIITGDDRVVHKSRQFYARAVNMVQKAINDTRYINSDLVSATMLLACFEVFDYSKGEYDPFINHTKGATQIIKLLGPDHFTDDYGRSVLMAFGGQLMFSHPTFKDGRVDYFLTEKQWIRVSAFDPGKQGEWQHQGLVWELAGHAIEYLVLRGHYKQVPPRNADAKKSFVPRILLYRSKLQDFRTRFQAAVPALAGRVTQGGTTTKCCYPYVPSSARAAALWCKFLSLSVSTNMLMRRVDPAMDFRKEDDGFMGQLDEAAQLVPVTAYQAKRAIMAFDTL